MIQYSINEARAFVPDKNTCVSAEDEEIIRQVRNMGLKVPFKRPKLIASNEAVQMMY